MLTGWSSGIVPGVPDRLSGGASCAALLEMGEVVIAPGDVVMVGRTDSGVSFDGTKIVFLTSRRPRTLP